MVTLHTHSGTHLDLPAHFCRDGRFPLQSREMTWFPCHARAVPVREGDPITVADLAPLVAGLAGAAALLLRTGAQASRESDPDRYASLHSWVDPEVPAFLRDRLPGLGLFGIDAISVATPSRRTAGRECHRGFLCKTPPIILLEDADLSDPRLTASPWLLRVFPYLAEELDGVPVVALAESLPEPAGTLRGETGAGTGPGGAGRPGRR
jgi:kynurenine formamidase